MEANEQTSRGSLMLLLSFVFLVMTLVELYFRGALSNPPAVEWAGWEQLRSISVAFAGIQVTVLVFIPVALSFISTTISKRPLLTIEREALAQAVDARKLANSLYTGVLVCVANTAFVTAVLTVLSVIALLWSLVLLRSTVLSLFALYSRDYRDLRGPSLADFVRAVIASSIQHQEKHKAREELNKVLANIAKKEFTFSVTAGVRALGKTVLAISPPTGRGTISVNSVPTALDRALNLIQERRVLDEIAGLEGDPEVRLTIADRMLFTRPPIPLLSIQYEGDPDQRDLEALMKRIAEEISGSDVWEEDQNEHLAEKSDILVFEVIESLMSDSPIIFMRGFKYIEELVSKSEDDIRKLLTNTQLRSLEKCDERTLELAFENFLADYSKEVNRSCISGPVCEYSISKVHEHYKSLWRPVLAKRMSYSLDNLVHGYLTTILYKDLAESRKTSYLKTFFVRLYELSIGYRNDSFPDDARSAYFRQWKSSIERILRKEASLSDESDLPEYAISVLERFSSQSRDLVTRKWNLSAVEVSVSAQGFVLFLADSERISADRAIKFLRAANARLTWVDRDHPTELHLFWRNDGVEVFNWWTWPAEDRGGFHGYAFSSVNAFFTLVAAKFLLTKDARYIRSWNEAEVGYLIAAFCGAGINTLFSDESSRIESVVARLRDQN